MLQSLSERIRQRRAQMLIHSYAYYVLDQPMVDDATWQCWADELELLQMLHPADVGFYDQAFADWDGTTGMHLPQDAWVASKARQVGRLHDARR